MHPITTGPLQERMESCLRWLPLLRCMAARLERAVRNREQYAAAYRYHLSQIPGIAFQMIRKPARSCFKELAILINEREFGMSRDILALALKQENIDTRPYFFPPLHRTRLGKRFLHQGDRLENTDRISRNVLCLPIYSQMRASDILKIVEAIISVRSAAKEIGALSRLHSGN